MNSIRPRLSSEVLKRGYSEDEVRAIYTLARFCLENGDINRSALIIQGLKEVAPEFAPAWLAQCYIDILAKSFDSAIESAKRALSLEPCAQAELFLAACYLSTGDYNSAGTYLGEVRERVESGQVEDSNLIRFYRTQLARFQAR